jgi:hypothetical protein
MIYNKIGLFLTVAVVVATIALSAASGASAQWMHVGLANQNVQTLAVNGTNIFAGTLDSGVYLSTDSGTNWVALNTGLTYNFISFGTDTINDALDAHSLAMSGKSIFAGTRGPGVFRSTSSGANWVAASNGLPTDYSILEAIEAMGTTLFASTGGGVYGNHIFRSTDSGTNWVETDSGGITNSPTYAFAVIGTKLFAGTGSNGVFVSTDSGTSWTITNQSVYPEVYSLSVSGTNLFAGTGQGYVFFSTDSGASWANASSGLPLGQYLYVESFAVYGSNIFAASDGCIFLSTNNGSIWNSVSTGLPQGIVFTSLVVAGTTLIAGTNNNGIWRRPLSEMTGSSGVAQSISTNQSLAAFPNPLAQSTTIRFTMPESGMAEIRILNALGEEVSQIFEGEINAGEHLFVWNPNGLPKGTYWCIARINSEVESTAMVVTR